LLSGLLIHPEKKKRVVAENIIATTNEISFTFFEFIFIHTYNQGLVSLKSRSFE